MNSHKITQGDLTIVILAFVILYLLTDVKLLLYIAFMMWYIAVID